MSLSWVDIIKILANLQNLSFPDKAMPHTFTSQKHSAEANYFIFAPTICNFAKKIKKMDLPNDPYMLLSMINMKLRDNYPNLDLLCDDLGIDRKQLESKLSTIDYKYIQGINQFR